MELTDLDDLFDISKTPQEGVLDDLFKIDPDMIVAGSYALSLYNLLNRGAIDIDIIVHDNELVNYLHNNAEEIKGSSLIKDHPYVKYIVSFMYKNVKLDIIHRTDIIPTTNLNGLPYKFATVKHIIEAKRYLIDNNKHKKDIDYIVETILKNVYI